jgi:hypothetical protein
MSMMQPLFILHPSSIQADGGCISGGVGVD